MHTGHTRHLVQYVLPSDRHASTHEILAEKSFLVPKEILKDEKGINSTHFGVL